MKKLLLLALLATTMVGCSNHISRKEINNAIPIIIVDEQGDSCEYYTNYGHKGNCRFCTERNKRIIHEQVDSILTEIFD